jgi:ATP-dependent 26S proteasome regulatory subunit
MSRTETTSAEIRDRTWAELHDAYLETHLDRLRLLARRQVDWLRAVRWRTDPLADSGADARVDRLLGAPNRIASSSTGRPPGGARDAGPVQDADMPPEGAQAGHAQGLEEAVAAHDRRLSELEVELAATGSPASLTVLQAAADLSVVECEAVVVALAPELDGTFRNLYAYLHDEPALRAATPRLVADLFGRPLPDVWELTDPDASARRFRVLIAGDGAATLRLDARMVAFLRGHNHPDERLRGVLEPMSHLPLSPAHRRLAQRLIDWLSDPDRRSGRQVVNLLGPPGQGREAVAAAVAHALGLACLRVNAGRVPGRGDGEAARLLDRESLLLPAALYVDAPGEAVEEPALAAAAEEFLDDLGGLVFVGGRTRHRGVRSTVAVPVPAPDPADRTQLWRDTLGMDGPTRQELAGLAEQFPLGPDAIVRAAEEACTLAELRAGRSGAAPGRAELWAACRATADNALGELATRIEPSAGWDDLVLPEREQRLLRDIAAQVAARPRVYEDWGFGPRLARGRGITALFGGPSGTGKTMAAEILAGHLDLDLYRIDLSTVISKYIGETEKNLRRVFDAAEQGGAILFFDEADALFGKRTEVSDSHDRHANVEVSYLLQRMEDYAGLAILATNRKTDLDAAFLRRIRFVVAFPFPAAADRRRIWQTVWPAATPLAELDDDALARLEIAGGNIRTIAVNAAFLAADAGEPVGMGHVMQAAHHEYDKLDRRPTRSEFGNHHQEVQP